MSFDAKRLTTLEARAEWRRSDVQDSTIWTERLTNEELAELDRALSHAKSKSTDNEQRSHWNKELTVSKVAV